MTHETPIRFFHKETGMRLVASKSDGFLCGDKLDVCKCALFDKECPKRRQSHVLFDDGYEEGWTACVAMIKAALAAPSVPDGWLRAIDEALVTAHIGVANAHDTYEQAKAKLDSLIGLHVDIATDPAVNGGYKLVPNDVVEQAVNRFLSWKLPKDFHPDGGIVFIPTKGRGYDSPHWPVGTNLLNAQQARGMLRYVLATSPENKP